jgi:hypothetical protein
VPAILDGADRLGFNAFFVREDLAFDLASDREWVEV